MARKQKRKKAPLIIAIIACTLVLAAVLFFLLGPQSENAHDVRFEKALKQHNYQAAGASMAEFGRFSEKMQAELDKHLEEFVLLCCSQEYNDQTWSTWRGIEVFAKQIKEPVLNKMTQLVEGYYTGSIDEQSVKTYVSRLGKFSFADEKLQDCTNAIAQKNASDKAYNEAYTLYLKQDYVAAYPLFKEVSPYDVPKKTSADAFMQNCIEQYCNPVYNTARQMIENNQVSEAKQIIKDALKAFSYKPLEDLLNTLE